MIEKIKWWKSCCKKEISEEIRKMIKYNKKENYKREKEMTKKSKQKKQLTNEENDRMTKIGGKRFFKNQEKL